MENMKLTLKEIEQYAQAMNLYMLNMGAPVEKDYAGYNGPDYMKMKRYGLNAGLVDPSIADLTEMVECLSHYVNTQLANDKDLIVAMLKTIKGEQEVVEPGNNAGGNGTAKPVTEHVGEIPKAVLGIDDEGCMIIRTLPFDPELNALIHQLKQNGLKIFNRKSEDGQWHVHLGRNALVDFCEGIKRLGYSQHLCDEIIAYAEEHELADKPVVKEVKVASYNKKDSIISLTFTKDMAVTEWIREHRDVCFWKKEAGKWSLQADAEKLPVLVEVFKAHDFDTSALDSIIKERAEEASIVVLPREIPVEPFKPYQFQLDDVKTMLEKKHCLLAAEMGCGKTHEAVRVGYSLDMNKLVICPPSLRLNWQDEILMCDPSADVGIIYSDTKNPKAHEWTIVGYSSLKKLETVLVAMNFNCVFADEAHYIKAVSNSGNPTSDRGRVALELADKAEYVYAITGTPKANRNLDLYNILRFIKHPMLRTMSFFKYGCEYCDGIRERFGWNFTGNSNDEALHQELSQYMIRHLKREVLPNLRKQRQRIPVTANAKEYFRLMDEAKEKMKENRKAGGKSVDIEVIALQTKARQSLAISKVKDTIDFADNILSSGEDESIVIVSCFTDVIKKLEDHFKGDCCKVVGGMSDKEKSEAIRDFQNGRKKVILLNIVAGGVGITLTRSHTMIINDTSWVPGELVQVEDRICRSGQTETCMIYYMLSQNVQEEWQILGILTGKSRTINEAVDGGRSESVNYLHLQKRQA